MLRQLGGEPECERKDGMRMKVDQLPGIPKHLVRLRRNRRMPGTSSVYPHEVLPSLERPQPVHWPQEVSNCLSLPPGNSASQTELGSAAAGVEVAFQQTTDGCTIHRGTKRASSFQNRRGGQRTERPSGCTFPRSPCTGNCWDLTCLKFIHLQPFYKYRQGAWCVSSELWQGAQ